MTSSSNVLDNYLTSTTSNFSVKFNGREEHFKLAIDKLSSLVSLKNKIQEIFLFKNGEQIEIEHMAYLDSSTDTTSDSLVATYRKYWVKLENDMDVQSMFRSVEFEKEPHHLEGIDDNNNDDDDTAFNPPGSMRILDDDLVDQPSSVLLYENHPLLVDAEIDVGVTFYSKKDCVNAIKSFHIKHSKQCHTEKSDTTRYIIRCNQQQCRFTLRAAHSKKTELWHIVSIGDHDTCISSGMTQDHRSLDAKMLAESIMPLLRDNLSITLAWLMVMEKWIPGTICRLETSPTTLHREVFFERLFSAFKPCIEGYTPSVSTFQYWRKRIVGESPKALRWLDNIPREKWTQAYDGGCRWGHMTSNLAESMNSVFKDIHNQPITALVQATYYKCGELFARRGRQSTAVLASGQGQKESVGVRAYDYSLSIECAIGQSEDQQANFPLCHPEIDLFWIGLKSNAPKAQRRIILTLVAKHGITTQRKENHIHYSTWPRPIRIQHNTNARYFFPPYLKPKPPYQPPIIAIREIQFCGLNTTQATKSKALGPIPNFSIGLTPSDEEKSDDNKANMREVYNTAAKTLQRRIGEANASTSRKLEPTPIDKAHKSEGEETDNSSTEKSPKNLPHLDDAGSRETSKSNEAEQDDNKSSGAEKGVEAEGEPSNPNPSTQAENRFNRDDNTKSNDENDSDEEVEIDPNMIDDSVKAACNVGISLTQETIQKFPEFFGPSNAAFNSENPLQATQETTNASESQLSATQETIMKYPEFLNDDSTEKEPEQSLALVATPLKSVLPDQIIDLDDITTKKRKKHNMLYSDTSYPERRRAVKKSKYLASPYDDAVHESTASDLQKILSSYAWSPDPDLSEHELLYYSNNKAHKYALERRDLWSLQQDEWVSCFVINAWVNCLNWNQQRDKMTRLVTPMVNYADLAKPGAFDKNNPAAFGRFIERLSKFSYLDWQTIDLNSLEYIMAPALMGDPGSHYVGFVVNLKDNKFEFLNSLKGESDNTQMDSFKGWKRMPKKQKVARMMDLRIGICSTIMGDTSNSGRNVVEDKARKYHAAKLGKLAT
ncbi:hypothetical protein QL285_058948 [Trifolium repens]|nr:hypothetical protein QL285_058948 [Trifolium repens]